MAGAWDVDYSGVADGIMLRCTVSLQLTSYFLLMVQG